MQQTHIGLGIVFAAGCDARTVGDPRSANPVEKGSPASSAWFAGWDEVDALVAETESAEFFGVFDMDSGLITIRGCVGPESSGGDRAAS
jgi:hypothetical protein